MSEREAVEKGYTHLGKYSGFYCYVKYEDDFGVDIVGTNWIRELMINIFVWIEVNIYSPNEAFVIEEIRELKT